MNSAERYVIVSRRVHVEFRLHVSVVEVEYLVRSVYNDVDGCHLEVVRISNSNVHFGSVGGEGDGLYVQIEGNLFNQLEWFVARQTLPQHQSMIGSSSRRDGSCDVGRQFNRATDIDTRGEIR